MMLWALTSWGETESASWTASGDANLGSFAPAAFAISPEGVGVDSSDTTTMRIAV